ncbi:MAG: CotH kinase family protein, partial [Bacteroidota bacterium]
MTRLLKLVEWALARPVKKALAFYSICNCESKGLRKLRTEVCPTNKYAIWNCLFFVLITCISTSCGEDMAGLEGNPPVVPKDTCSLDFLRLDGTACALDESSNTFYYALPNLEMDFQPVVEYGEEKVALFIQDKVIANKGVHDLGTVRVNDPITFQVKNCDGGSTDYNLIFTSLPLVQITTNSDEVILDNPKIMANFQLQDPQFAARGLTESTFSSFMGIETRGGNAQSFDKKSYSFELKKDDLGQDERSEPLLGMRDDDDWILDAMFIDPARMRNRVSTDVWLDFQRLYYQN